MLAECLGRLWLLGVELDWTEVHAGEGVGRIPLPTYPFQRQRYWIERTPAIERGPAAAPGG